MGNDRKRLREWVLAQEPRFSKEDVFGYDAIADPA